MPSFGHTPEALLGRNDSKNPSTTCKGLTMSGRPCRRGLSSSNIINNNNDKSRGNMINGGVVALVREEGQVQEADFYCWQHKDQARDRIRKEEEGRGETAKGSRKRRSFELFPLRERGSFDTLAEKLGISGLPARNVIPEEKSKGRRERNQQHRHRPSRPYEENASTTNAAQRPSRPRKRTSFWASLCCMRVEDDDYIEIVRHRRKPDSGQQRLVEGTPRVPPHSTTIHSTTLPVRAKPSPARDPRITVRPRPPPNTKQSPASNRNADQLLSLIPSHCSPETTSALLTELIKPISSNDEEGYIYIFWLTPQTKAAPPQATARSLLTTARPHNERRISDVMTEYSYDGHEDPSRSQSARNNQSRRTIMLKIGRASNITRRMNEWQRQCGYALTLIRWYPYIPSTAQSPPSSIPSGTREVQYPDLSRYSGFSNPSPRRHSDVPAAVRKVPCVKRVERLIHLELAGQQAKRQCDVCQKEHREWFEVEASRAGVMAVDETVKRWVDWAERTAEN